MHFQFDRHWQGFPKHTVPASAPTASKGLASVPSPPQQRVYHLLGLCLFGKHKMITVASVCISLTCEVEIFLSPGPHIAKGVDDKTEASCHQPGSPARVGELCPPRGERPEKPHPKNFLSISF